MRPGTGFRTSKLATARLELRNDRRNSRVLFSVVTIALLILLAVAGSRPYLGSLEPTRRLAALTQQNAALRAELARHQAELKLERATRAALARQVAELNEQKTQLSSRLDFFNAQSGRAGATR